MELTRKESFTVSYFQLLFDILALILAKSKSIQHSYIVKLL